MDITIIPGKLHGTIDARPSRESALLHETARRLTHFPAVPQNPGKADDLWDPDLEAVRQCMTLMPGDAPQLPCARSENAFCLLLPVAAALKHKCSFTGTGTLPDLPITPYTDLLRKHGTAFSRGTMKIRRRDRGKFQEICTLSGRMTYGDYSLTGRESPYFIAGLLFALPFLEGNSTVRMTTLPDSIGFVRMAVSVLRDCGIEISDTVDDYGYPFFSVPGNQKFRLPDTAAIEGDWGAAALWLACGAIGGDVTIRGLSGDSWQNARQILDKLRSLGAGTGYSSAGANVIAGKLRGCNINAAHIPELVPALSVVMATAPGTSMLTGLDGQDQNSVFRALDVLGADVSNGGSGFSFTGKAILTGGEINSFSDPAVVMVAAAASCLCRMPVTIRNAGVVNRVYPNFFDDFEKLGGVIER